MRALLIAGWALPFFVACGATKNRTFDPGTREAVPETPRAAEASAPTTEPDEVPPVKVLEPVVAYVDGQPILAAELMAAWLHEEAPVVKGFVDKLVLQRLVWSEAQRLGATSPPNVFDEALSSALTRLSDSAAAENVSIETYLLRRGLDPKAYLSTLRGELAIDLLASRVVRAWMLTQERAEVRVVVTEDGQRARNALAEIEAGMDFSDVAARYSVEGKETGGRIPPVVRGGSAIADLAFDTLVGEVAGPIEQEGRWLLLIVDTFPAPLQGDWTLIGPEVEASLAQSPIADPEYWQWKTWVTERYPIDTTPLSEWTGDVLAR